MTTRFCPKAKSRVIEIESLSLWAFWHLKG